MPDTAAEPGAVPGRERDTLGAAGPLSGLGVGPGRTAGPVFRLAPPPGLPARPPPVVDPEAELTAATRALGAVADELRRLADAAEGPAAEVLRTQAMMAGDPVIADAVAAKVDQARPAAWAISDAVAEQQEALLALGGYFAERTADLADIRDRAVAEVLGLPRPGLPSPGVPFVLVAEDLSPADTARLDLDTVLAIVTGRGGPTGHTAILARSRGLPAVVSCQGILDLAEGTVVSVDGTTGIVAIADDKQAVAGPAPAQRERDRQHAVTGPGRTADGHPIPLLRNIGGATDLAGDTTDIEGVGLLRTEFLFLHRTDPPTTDEQQRAYTEVFAALPGRKIVVRTLDAGADKPLPFLGLAPEDNPALGVRGLRTARQRPDVLADQLRAISKAAAATGADVWLMAPMVATAAEAASFAEQARAAGLSTVGAMIEVPAAALRARQLLEVVDFVSIGTNDLGQYTLAADRTNGALADLLDPWQPALLELIATCADAGKVEGKPVGVCGEAAGDPLLALVLTGMGVTSLSMSGPNVAPVRATLAAHTRGECEHLARLALAAPDAATARSAVAAQALSG
ncbi:phosphoenolpyruvate-protein phosphotransferase [Saccharomonospora marina XMU15]|uniref:Phosphoenolpyruvate-protein phosphotransferase n=1 Tax=Saccharomonospora marina XMU15 TaxID=882083 RepID=H5WXW4_9PSEU|nr:phosphoenolpyruvate--protein phosphotransferase [Saccharomonospora marina]EHR51773.1 phosphoenolpyruvate-protein phosphotransferase [Saccharomonospora marina XMU15]